MYWRKKSGLLTPTRIPVNPKDIVTLMIIGTMVLALTGCAITIPSDTYRQQIAYEPVRAQTHIDANVGLVVTHELSPQMRAMWKQWLNTDESIANWEQAVRRVVEDDIMRSGIFSSVVLNFSPSTEFIVKVISEESRAQTAFKLKVSLVVINARTQAQIFNYTREALLGDSMFTYSDKLKENLRNLLADIKTNLIADFKTKPTSGEPEISDKPMSDRPTTSGSTNE